LVAHRHTLEALEQEGATRLVVCVQTRVSVAVRRGEHGRTRCEAAALRQLDLQHEVVVRLDHIRGGAAVEPPADAKVPVARERVDDPRQLVEPALTGGAERACAP
jgi:hypothetical protein